MNIQTIWTYSLQNDSIVITSDFNFTRVSFILISGTGKYKGGLTANGVASTFCDLVVGQSIQIDISTSSIINNIELTTTGEIQIIGRG